MVAIAAACGLVPAPAWAAPTNRPAPAVVAAPLPPPPRRPVVTATVGFGHGRLATRDTVIKRSKWYDPMRPLVVGEVGPELGMRDFRYGQAQTAGLRSYANHGIAMGSASLQVYPFALSAFPVFRDIGLIGSFGSSLSSDATTAAGTGSVAGTWTRYDVGARIRLRVNDPPGATWVGLAATYGDSKFAFSGVDPLSADAPAVEYKYARGGADVRVPFGRFSFIGAAGYRYIWSSGSLGQRFPRSNTGGGDLQVGGAYRINTFFEARATAEYLAILTQANTRPGDRFIAGQALDQYAVFHVGITGFLF
jgi:hypothetical protein